MYPFKSLHQAGPLLLVRRDPERKPVLSASTDYLGPQLLGAPRGEELQPVPPRAVVLGGGIGVRALGLDHDAERVHRGEEQLMRDEVLHLPREVHQRAPAAAARESRRLRDRLGAGVEGVGIRLVWDLRARAGHSNIRSGSYMCVCRF